MRQSSEFRSPPPENGNARSVAAPAAPGAGVCTLSLGSHVGEFGGGGASVCLCRLITSQCQSRFVDAVPNSGLDHDVQHPHGDREAQCGQDRSGEGHSSDFSLQRVHAVSSPKNSASHSTPVRLSNLDLRGKLVKRGHIVSWHGFRYRVTKVRLGSLWGRLQAVGGGDVAIPLGSYLPDQVLPCESVQVVA